MLTKLNDAESELDSVIREIEDKENRLGVQQRHLVEQEEEELIKLRQTSQTFESNFEEDDEYDQILQ